MANYSSGLPRFDNEYFQKSSETSASPYSSRDCTFESFGRPIVPECEDFCCAYPIPNIKPHRTMSQASQDSDCYSEFYYPEFYSTTDQPSNSMNPLNFEDRTIRFLDNCVPLGCESPPIPSRSHAESANSSKKAHKSTSSSNSSIPQRHSRTFPKYEAAFACRSEVGKYQESRHTTKSAPRNDRHTASSTSHRPKPYSCMFPECEARFSRPYDLGRHQQSRHVTSKRFDCPVENCRRYGVPVGNEKGGFTRLDHFRDHVKNLHCKTVIKDKDSNGGQYWVLDPLKGDGELWMRDETGSIRMKDRLGQIRVVNAKTGRLQQMSWS